MDFERYLDFERKIWAQSLLAGRYFHCSFLFGHHCTIISNLEGFEGWEVCIIFCGNLLWKSRSFL